MSLWKIAWRSIQQRGLASALTSLSMALGVMLVVAVLSVYGVVHKSFSNNASLGYNMIVGPTKGSKLDLTLNTVYYLSAPLETLSYEYFLEFQPREVRDPAIENSLRAGADAARRDLLALQSLTAFSDLAPWSTLVTQEALEVARPRLLDLGRDGKYSQYTKRAIPVTLGDYFGPFRVVGTEPGFFEPEQVGDELVRRYTFAEGRNFERWNKEHGFYEAVVGATVAREKGVKLGDIITTTHGDPEGAGHGTEFTVVGILESNGTPSDRAAYINIEGFYLMENHAKPVPKAKPDPEEQEAGPPDANSSPPHGAHAGTEGDAGAPTAPLDPLVLEQREITAMLIKTVNRTVAPGLENAVNKGEVAQAALPVREIYALFQIIVRPVQTALLALTVIICVVSGISILVSIYNSMNDRRHEIAVMRALGANRRTVFTIILFESIFLSLGGGVLGWLSGHALNAAASDKVEQVTGVSISFFSLAPAIDILDALGYDQSIEWLKISPEVLLVPGLIVLAILVGLVPAFAAYRTDVSKSLGT